MRRLFAVRFHSPRLLPVLFTLSLLLVGCSAATSMPTTLPTATNTPALSNVRPVSTPATRAYLGAIKGAQALLGIVLNGTWMRAYVCDGTPSYLATLAEWFSGQVKDGKVQFSSQDQQAQLTPQFSSQSANATLRLASGRVYPFSIPQVGATAQVGVFEGTALIAGQRYHAG
jgi:hypothetical protein